MSTTIGERVARLKSGRAGGRKSPGARHHLEPAAPGSPSGGLPSPGQTGRDFLHPSGKFCSPPRSGDGSSGCPERTGTTGLGWCRSLAASAVWHRRCMVIIGSRAYRREPKRSVTQPVCGAVPRPTRALPFPPRPTAFANGFVDLRLPPRGITDDRRIAGSPRPPRPLPPAVGRPPPRPDSGFPSPNSRFRPRPRSARAGSRWRTVGSIP